MPNSQFHTVSAPKSLKELAEIAGAQLHDSQNADVIIANVSALQDAGAEDISFLDNIKYKDDFKSTEARACIIAPAMLDFAPEGCSLLISDNPYKSYALVAQAFYPDDMTSSQDAVISDKAYVDPSVTLGTGCVVEAGAVLKEGVKLGDFTIVEANAVIGRNVEIGSKSRVGANATVSHAVIGHHTRLYPGVRIGQDGFGFAIDPAGHVKVPQLGTVQVGDHVEIGANTCIDRGAGPDTIIGDGTWIDNCVQIGHNVKVGRGCVIVAQAGIAGSTVIEDYVVVAAQVGIAGHLTIGMGSRIAAQSGIMQNLPPKSEVMGSPALPIKQHLRQVALLKKMIKR